MKNFTFKKNVLGGLIIELDSYDFSLPRRKFDLAPLVSQVVVPETYALGLFVSDDALNMYKMGLFTIEDFEDLQKKASEIGLFGDVECGKVYSAKEIAEAVVKNDQKIIDQICAKKNPVELANLIVAARENINSEVSTINQSTVRKIEDTCGVELTIE